ncbi:hypothetical protein [Sulfolobus acidocaldarius]|uniref:Conserved protein n=4 Tax=Sulfolobus acidocaldarius TaxID=2285 RepID=Q4JB31_SULAC|nr:hypothetical protein [Sulfolobus acidocaldarius]AHC51012.1 hypothetical protein SUSAZ_02750 [Sulfolobus acidocaldarius SUSAZ]AAY79998.1 conserved protein [Sulfolobus acidocaldarius DSM 639]AGE70567.1 hypothetical protein SacN8_02945 [Sulfolobus acidocaldarius N8]AGE72840.1 hypothetical protein SacRon12I_02935 [Sulfolobus acidocaldarius Ron12/I]ALU29074.1 hypothetical protein ATY89_03365 [Sulfolobus acidocaldarius]
MKVLINIELKEVDQNLKDILFGSILVEKVDERVVSINEKLGTITITSNSVSRGRAVINSYISWIYTILETLNKVKNA